MDVRVIDQVCLRVLKLLVFGALLSVFPIQTAAKVALVVGVENYDRGPDLVNARADAQAVAQALQRRGFSVALALDPSRREMLVALAKLRISAADSDLVLIYFAGHGAQIDGNPVVFLRDASIAEEDAGSDALPIQIMVKAISDRPRQKLLLVDACRTEGRKPSPRPTVADAPATAGLHVEFAAQFGSPAYDGVGALGPFASAWVSALADAETDFDKLVRMARLDVIRATGGVQIPWSQSSLLRPINLGLQVSKEE